MRRVAKASTRGVNYATSPLLASKTPRWRSRFIVALVGLGFAGLVGRAAYIQIVRPDFYTYDAQFVPDNPADDAMSQNNRATTFTHVRGSGHVLLIESLEERGEHDHLVDRLRANNLEVTVQPDNQLFQSLTELQAYDTVILANVPRSDGDDATRLTHFGEDQIKMLVRNTEDRKSVV